MIIGLTIWGERISPVFDSSHMLLVAEVQGSSIIKNRFEPFEPAVPFLLSEKLRALKIEILICGAISMEPANLIELAGIKLIPFISGPAKPVLESYLRGEALATRFIMPGCGKTRGKGNCQNGTGQGYGCGKTLINKKGIKQRRNE